MGPDLLQETWRGFTAFTRLRLPDTPIIRRCNLFTNAVPPATTTDADLPATTTSAGRPATTTTKAPEAHTAALEARTVEPSKALQTGPVALRAQLERQVQTTAAKTEQSGPAKTTPPTSLAYQAAQSNSNNAQHHMQRQQHAQQCNPRYDTIAARTQFRRNHAANNKATGERDPTRRGWPAQPGENSKRWSGLTMANQTNGQPMTNHNGTPVGEIVEPAHTHKPGKATRSATARPKVL